MSRYEVRTVDRRGAYARALGDMIGAMPRQWQRDNAWADVVARTKRGAEALSRIQPELTRERHLSLGRKPQPAVDIETARAKRRGQR